MNTNLFDTEFQKMTTEMVELAFEYTGFNKEEVDSVFIYGSMENKNYFYDLIYNVNKVICYKHEINSFLNNKVDVSAESQQNLMMLGCKALVRTAQLFRSNEREVPTLLKMIYSPKTGKFKCDVSYEPQYSNHAGWSNVTVFQNWYNEIKMENS